MVMDYRIKDLISWNKKIEAILEEIGFNYYQQEFELCSFEDMIAYEAYSGMPSRYPHWSFGKAFERIKTFYKYNLSGLPYEMVINSNPCLAYLMKNNSLLLQILTMAHVYGHNDFFKNNRLFKETTNADYTLEMYKTHADRIRKYISNPGITYKGVERILDAAHAIKLQTSRVINQKNRNKEKETERFEGEKDLLNFLLEYGDLKDWEKDILEIVAAETRYFIPQIETKIMNEGWASYWHYQILKKLDIPQGMYLEFIKRHNQVISPAEGGLNPYHIGFSIFNKIKSRYPEKPEKLFEVRELERDESFIRKYLDFELINDLNLLKYKEEDDYYIISEIADQKGWKEIRNTLADSVGLNKVPVIKVASVSKINHVLYLEHEYNKKELELKYAMETLKYISNLWQGKVYLKTVLDKKCKTIICNENEELTIRKCRN